MNAGPNIGRSGMNAALFPLRPAKIKTLTDLATTLDILS
jgi:hypothetical protein